MAPTSAAIGSKWSRQHKHREWRAPCAFCNPEIWSVASEHLQQQKKWLWMFIHAKVVKLCGKEINVANLGVRVNTVIEREAQYLGCCE